MPDCTLDSCITCPERQDCPAVPPEERGVAIVRYDHLMALMRLYLLGIVIELICAAPATGMTRQQMQEQQDLLHALGNQAQICAIYLDPGY